MLRILADGEPVWQSERRFDVPADSACTFDVEWPVDLYRANANELVLEVSQRLAEATDWLLPGTNSPSARLLWPERRQPRRGPACGRHRHCWPLECGCSGSGREILLSRTQGGLVSYTFDGHEFVLRRPAITTFRALTDNDRGAGHGFERAQWMAAGRYARCVDNVIEQVDEDTLKAVYTYELATPQRTKVTVEYTPIPLAV